MKRLTLLVLRAQAGDRAAMNRLLESHQSELCGYLMKMLRDPNDAEDALQATLLQAVKKLRWLREPTCFRSWIFRIASRQAFAVIKRRHRQKELTNAEYVDAEFISNFTDRERQELIDQIPHWLEKLTVNGREVILLHYLEGFTTEEVANILDIPVGTAKSRISYALDCIRKQTKTKKG